MELPDTSYINMLRQLDPFKLPKQAEEDVNISLLRVSDTRDSAPSSHIESSQSLSKEETLLKEDEISSHEKGDPQPIARRKPGRPRKKREGVDQTQEGGVKTQQRTKSAPRKRGRLRKVKPTE